MSVCLIIPPSPFLLDERVFVSLGVLRVAGSLERAGHRVELLDLSGVANYEEAVAAHVSSSISCWFGITSTTPQMPAAHRIAERIRQCRHDAVLCLGGPHPTLVAAAQKREQKLGCLGRADRAMESLRSSFDVIVTGDGEDAVFQALGATVGHGVVIDADDPRGPLFLTNRRYEQLAPPARHLVDMGSYRYSIDGRRATSLIAQLGCPFACGFCGGRESPMLRRIRTRSTQSILDELRFLHGTYGYDGFMFYDDELNVSKTLVELMNGIKNLQDELGVEFRLRGFVKAELFNEQQAEAMYSAGFRWLLTGFESGSPRILENINKKATREENTNALRFARSAGMKVKALMSIGHPGESRETVEETRQWLWDTKPDDFDVTIITTYPGSPYYDYAVPGETLGTWTYSCPKNGDRLHAYELDYNQVADYYKGAPGGGYRSYVYTDHLSAEELVTLRDQLETDVRGILGISFNQARPALRFEHSMGQSGPLPANILRVSEQKTAAAAGPSLRVIQ